MTKNEIFDAHWPELINLSCEVTRQEQLAVQQAVKVEEAKRALRDYVDDVQKKMKVTA